jgi:hypothetical protein
MRDDNFYEKELAKDLKKKQKERDAIILEGRQVAQRLEEKERGEAGDTLSLQPRDNEKLEHEPGAKAKTK